MSVFDAPVAPTVYVDADDQLRIRWPGPKPEVFLIAAELFEALINEVNASRELMAERNKK